MQPRYHGVPVDVQGCSGANGRTGKPGEIRFSASHKEEFVNAPLPPPQDRVVLSFPRIFLETLTASRAR
jgi:hypothetical protein